MIDIVQHWNGKWFIALNPCRVKGEYLVEFAWTGTTWARESDLVLYFTSLGDAKSHLKANRNLLEAEYLKIT